MIYEIFHCFATETKDWDARWEAKCMLVSVWYETRELARLSLPHVCVRVMATAVCIATNYLQFYWTFPAFVLPATEICLLLAAASASAHALKFTHTRTQLKSMDAIDGWHNQFLFIKRLMPHSCFIHELSMSRHSWRDDFAQIVKLL